MEKGKKVLTAALNILFPVVFALGVGAVFILISGKDPIYVYKFLISQSLLNKTGFMYTLASATPIIMTGLGIAVSFKAGLYNMGIEGQMYIGAFFATYLGFTLKGLPGFVHVPVCILGGMVMGMLYSLIPAILKSKFQVNEMVVTMMLNYVAIIFTKYLTNGPFSAKVGFPATELIADSAKLTRFDSRVPLTAGFFIAVGLVILVTVLYKKMKLGYEIESMGKQIEYADCVGMRVDKKIILLFLISGAISGIAGATEIMSVHYRFTPGFSTNPGLGWDGQLVALLASHNPVGVLVAAIFFGALKYGGTTMQTFVGLSNDTVGIIQAALVLFLSVRYVSQNSGIFIRAENWYKKRTAQRETDKGANS